MWRMANPRMDYAWGSTTSIPEFLGEEPTGDPVAELWIGAHPKAPSVLLDFKSPRSAGVGEEPGGSDVPLDEALRQHPELLGDDVAARFGELPYLVKLLAAGGPLSLQVHPSEETAREGFAREEADGVALDAGNRTYKDPHHKPETMIALAESETLAGFRSAEEVRSLLKRLDLPWADAVAEFLPGADGGSTGPDMAPAFAALLDKDAWADARDSVLAQCESLVGPGGSLVEPGQREERAQARVETNATIPEDPHRAGQTEAPEGLASEERAAAHEGPTPSTRPFSLILDLDRAFPHDSGAAAPLLLNIAHYAPGEALFVPTGEIHAHISGFGIEVMAASDNVIRAGLTPKFVDVEALFGSLITTPNPPHLMETGERMEFPVREFAVATLTDGDVDGPGPRILLAHDGPCTLTLDGQELTLGQGESAFISDGESPRLSGRATVVSTAPLAG